ncbi:hypothetical protein KA005_36030 [bacterium]|nr:hypothetical protein [bacterium]
MYVLESLGNQSGYEALAPTGSTGFTSSFINPTSGIYKGKTAVAVMIGVESNPIRFRLDGAAATALNGMKLNKDNYITIVGAANVKGFRCMDTSAGASSVKCLAYF